MVDTDEHGRPEGPFDGPEADTVLGFLEYQRGTLAWKCGGLTDEQLRAGLPSTGITLGGLLMHLARVEDYWFGEVVAEQPKLEPWASMPWSAEWKLAAERTGEELRELWSARVQAARAVVSQALSTGDGIGGTHPAWDGQGRPSLRWVLVHMVEEYARHNGHADLIRESIDGLVGE